MTPDETLRVLRTFDRAWAVEARKHNIRITCQRGCSACCSEPCYISRDEADLLVSRIPANELPGVRERTRAWLMVAELSGTLREETPHVLTYLSRGLTCPLLKNSVCLVYSARPLACRSHCAVGASDLCKANRMAQSYAVLPMPIVNAVRAMTLEGDHLGVWLSKLLLQIPMESAARVNVMGVQATVENILNAAQTEGHQREMLAKT